MNVLRNIIKWFKTAKPEPTRQDFLTQLGVHFEEISEMVEALRGDDRMTQSMLTQAMIVNHALALHLKSGKAKVAVMPVAFIDACCDQLVTATGVAIFAGMDIEGALAEVDRSNWSKFVNGQPILDNQGKIQKGPNYTPADLMSYVVNVDHLRSPV